MENVLIDFTHSQGYELGKEIERNIYDQKLLQFIHYLKPEFGKDGNQFYFILGDLPTGIVGFGETGYKAMESFHQNFHNQTA